MQHLTFSLRRECLFPAKQHFFLLLILQHQRAISVGTLMTLIIMINNDLSASLFIPPKTFSERPACDTEYFLGTSWMPQLR